MGIAYFGLVSVVIALFVLYSNQAHETATREAATKAAAATQVGQCFTSVKNAPVTFGFIDAHEAIIENGLIANRAAIDASPPSDPLRPIRAKSIVRLEKARRNVTQLRQLIRSATPTKPKCVELADKLDVDATRYLKGQP
jgi:hypothetical protein